MSFCHEAKTEAAERGAAGTGGTDATPAPATAGQPGPTLGIEPRLFGLCSPRTNPIGHRSWSVQLQHNWPEDDAWLRPGLEIAFAIPTSTDQRLLGVDDFLPSLLANYEMTQRSNPALSKPVIRKSLPRLHY
jgi:hypothetical protein